MKAVRIGNDVRNIEIPVTRFSEPFSSWDELVDLKVLAFERARKNYTVVPTETFKEDGKLRLYFAGTALKLGIYDLLITFSLADPISPSGFQHKAIDIQKIFAIVEYTSQEVDSQDDFAVALEYAKDGLNYYQIWSQYHDGTIEDMIAWHRQPAVDAAAALNQLASAFVETASGWEQNEQTRETQETTRQENETTRGQNEQTRETQETTRQENETTRGQNEQTRETQETTRQENETTRGQNEETRGTQETTRQENETTRGQNEETRETQETTRQENETTRGQNEQTRGTQETTRQQQEAARVQAELDRAATLALKADKLALEKTQQEVSNLEYLLQNANLNNEARATVIDYTTIPLPKTAANGSCDVKLEGQSAENLVVNGDFRNGFVAPWIIVSATQSIVNGLLTITPTAQYGRMTCPVTFLANNAYWISARISTNKAGSVHYGVVAGEGQILLPNTSGVLTKFSNIFAPTVNRSFYEIVDKSTSNWGAIGVDTGYGLRAINLTAIYGAGNEPDLATCDKIFANYFEGTKHAIGVGRYKGVGKNILSGEIKGAATPLININFTKIKVVPNLSYKISVQSIVWASSWRFAYKLFKNKIEVTSLFEAFNERGSYFNSSWGNVVVWSADSVLLSDGWTGKDFDEIWICLTRGNVTSSTITNMAQVERFAITSFELHKETKLYFNAGLLRSNGAVRDEISRAANGYQKIQRIATDGTVLATPVTTPLNTAGVLMSNPQGTIYREYAIADAGLYTTKMDILLTSYPISSLEEIKVIDAQGNETYLDTATAVIASNGLSFTHPSLVAGNLVFFSYFFNQERVEGKSTVSYYDSRVVKLDTANGKFYKINPVLTNGVITWVATEV